MMLDSGEIEIHGFRREIASFLQFLQLAPFFANMAPFFGTPRSSDPRYGPPLQPNKSYQWM
jgi:hypothetical protein